MAIDADLVSIPVRLDMDALAPPFTRALASLDAASTKVLDAAGVPGALRELVRIRASQINGCAYCVDQHSSDAVAGGESPRRLAALAVWAESGAFTVRERAALAFAEVVTTAASTHVPDDAFAAARSVFSEEESAALLALIVTINAWNAVGVSARPWPVTYDAASDR